ncbi:MAG: hypothetical protein AUI14_18460 [Actinobacteria bacterium 13_2_20CM_2_71_6]|nr:MAG: hypothetical protein AUI14_18460 [Actinobacteria bacterium 13_2_20CM_2_71_6]
MARPIAYLLTIGAAVLAALGIAAPARASDGPNSVSISGPGLSAPITVRDSSQRDLFNRLLHQVGWMAGRGGDPIANDPAKLGAKYELTVYTDDKATQRYGLYPQAIGGPKAFRPADQPGGRSSDAWFYISMSVPELLHAAGVPLVDPNASGSPGALLYRDPAGYVPASVNSDTKPLFTIGDVLNSQRRTLLLWVGTAFGILLLVVAAARWSRRYSH